MIHPTADVSPSAHLGANVRVWNQAQIRENAVLGDNVIVSKNVYIDAGVHIGANTKIQNNVSIYHGVTIGYGVFVGPHVCFTNDRVPRAISSDGIQKAADDWEVAETVVDHGASIGAHSVILPGVTIGSFALVGAGAVVTHSVPPHGLVLGNPARLVGYVCDCGGRLLQRETDMQCPKCHRFYPMFGERKR